MKKTTKITFYSDYDYDFNEMKQDFIMNNDVNETEVTDNMVWNYISDCLSDDWNMFEHMLSKLSGKWVLAGNIKTWRGTHYGYKLVDSLENELCKLGDQFKIWEENGHLHINAYHHDGGCFVEAKLLTGKGEDLYSNWEYDYNTDKSEADILETIFNSNFYSKLPHISKYW